MLKRFRLRNLNIGWKYGVTLLLIFILFASATSIVTILNTNIQHNIDDADRRGDRAIKVTEMGSLTRGKSIRILNYIMYGDQKFIDEYRERQEKFNVLEADLRERMDTEAEKELFEQIRENDIRLNDLFDQIIQAADSENTTLVDQLAIEAGNVRAETVDLLEKLRENVNDTRNAAFANAKGSASLATYTLLGSMGASILIGVLLMSIAARLSQQCGVLSHCLRAAEPVSAGEKPLEQNSFQWLLVLPEPFVTYLLINNINCPAKRVHPDLSPLPHSIYRRVKVFPLLPFSLYPVNTCEKNT